MELINKISLFKELLRIKITRAYKPCYVLFGITSRCNLRCEYCFASSDEKREDLSTAEVLRLIDDLKTNGTRIINLTGGEALLRSDIVEITSYIRDKGISYSLNTNGILLPDYIDKLPDPSHITVSLDGPEEVHDKLRGKGSFDKSVKAIQLVIKRKIPIRISSVLTKENMGCIQYLAETAARHGALIQLSPCYRRFKKENSDASYFLDKGELIQVIDQVMGLKKKGFPIQFSRKTLEYIRAWPFNSDTASNAEVNEQKGFSRIPCMAGKAYMRIEPDGYVYPCVVTTNRCGGNIKTKTIKECFDSLKTNNCAACMLACYTENNLLFSLSPGSLKKYISSF